MKKIIVGNWKMNPTSPDEVERIFSKIKKYSSKPGVEVVITPPSIFVPLLRDRGIQIGVQNAHHKKRGSFTGEISPEMAAESGCKYIIVGHSERRRVFGESNQVVNKKLKKIFETELKAILCVGESKKEKKDGMTAETIKRQLEAALSDLKFKNEKLIIGYEPVWAIGSGNPCDSETAFKMRLLIKKIISRLFSRDVAEEVRIVYGGSVDSNNCMRYVEDAKFDGLLVGGASLKPEEFSGIIKKI